MQTTSFKEKVQKQTSLARATMPKYYGFRKRPVVVEMPNGDVRLETLKMADKKGLVIQDLLGLSDKVKVKTD